LRNDKFLSIRQARRNYPQHKRKWQLLCQFSAGAQFPFLSASKDSKSQLHSKQTGKIVECKFEKKAEVPDFLENESIFLRLAIVHSLAARFPFLQTAQDRTLDCS
jgi:hypothetical protein